MIARRIIQLFVVGIGVWAGLNEFKLAPDLVMLAQAESRAEAAAVPSPEKISIINVSINPQRFPLSYDGADLLIGQSGNSDDLVRLALINGLPEMNRENGVGGVVRLGRQREGGANDKAFAGHDRIAATEIPERDVGPFRSKSQFEIVIAGCPKDTSHHELRERNAHSGVGGFLGGLGRCLGCGDRTPHLHALFHSNPLRTVALTICNPLAAFPLRLAGEPEFVSGPPQGDCGQGKNNREKGGDGAFVFIKEAGEQNEPRQQRAIENAAIFYGGLLIAGVIAYFMARKPD